MRTFLQTVSAAILGAVAALLLGTSPMVRAQQNVPQTSNVSSLGVALPYKIAITSTAAVSAIDTLTIPAPAVVSQFNYICSLGYDVSSDLLGGPQLNVVSTSTNFGTFSLETSIPAGAGVSKVHWYEYWGDPSTGCVKSHTAGTATTFISPANLWHQAWTWTATYYQGV